MKPVWDSLDSRLTRGSSPPTNVNELRQALFDELNNIPNAEINTLFNYVLPRCTAVVNSRGGHRPFLFVCLLFVLFVFCCFFFFLTPTTLSQNVYQFV